MKFSFWGFVNPEKMLLSFSVVLILRHFAVRDFFAIGSFPGTEKSHKKSYRIREHKKTEGNLNFEKMFQIQ